MGAPPYRRYCPWQLREGDKVGCIVQDGERSGVVDLGALKGGPCGSIPSPDHPLLRRRPRPARTRRPSHHYSCYVAWAKSPFPESPGRHAPPLTIRGVVRKRCLGKCPLLLVRPCAAPPRRPVYWVDGVEVLRQLEGPRASA